MTKEAGQPFVAVYDIVADGTLSRLVPVKPEDMQFGEVYFVQFHPDSTPIAVRYGVKNRCLTWDTVLLETYTWGNERPTTPEEQLWNLHPPYTWVGKCGFLSYSFVGGVGYD